MLPQKEEAILPIGDRAALQGSNVLYELVELGMQRLASLAAHCGGRIALGERAKRAERPDTCRERRNKCLSLLLKRAKYRLSQVLDMHRAHENGCLDVRRLRIITHLQQSSRHAVCGGSEEGLLRDSREWCQAEV